jgi:hypothetical protein
MDLCKQLDGSTAPRSRLRSRADSFGNHPSQFDTAEQQCFSAERHSYDIPIDALMISHPSQPRAEYATPHILAKRFGRSIH